MAVFVIVPVSVEQRKDSHRRLAKNLPFLQYYYTEVYGLGIYDVKGSVPALL